MKIDFSDVWRCRALNVASEGAILRQNQIRTSFAPVHTQVQNCNLPSFDLWQFTYHCASFCEVQFFGLKA
jgi:hypothetical protein